MAKHKWRIVVALLGVLLLAGVVVLMLPAPPKAVQLDVTGTPGMKVEGTCVVDGEALDLSGVVPFSKSFTARTLTFSIKRASEAGELHVAMHIEGGVSRSAGTTGPEVRGQMHAGRVGGLFGSSTSEVNTFSSDQ